MWIARDKNDKLYLYVNKPIKREEDFFPVNDWKPMEIPNDLYLNITFENSPQEIHILTNEELEEIKQESWNDGRESLEDYFGDVWSVD